ncbi:MAG: hypothetical protein JW841_17235 [Deltaproteobacteria bacterium]|nr:hypothetical protein [Deltaproteobacteria bacterium]
MDTKIKAVYTFIENEKLDKPFSRRIGTGFVNRDGSINIILDALPVSGRLHVRDIDLRRDDTANNEKKEVETCAN